MNRSLLVGFLLSNLAAGPPQSAREPFHRVIDLSVGETQRVTLRNGKEVAVTLVDLKETKDELRVEHTGPHGWKATAHLHVRVGVE